MLTQIIQPVSRASRRALAFAVGLSVLLIVGMQRLAAAAPNDGTVEAVDGDAPGDVWAQIQDRVIEWTPTIIVIFAGILIFGFTMLLLAVGSRKALSKLTMLVRRA